SCSLPLTPPRSALFPYTTLFRSLVDLLGAVIEARSVAQTDGVGGREQAESRVGHDHAVLVEQGQSARLLEHALDHEHHVRAAGVDRKSTRLNSSHVKISYAVFCL